MSDLSNIIITGRMGKDPEVRTTKNGTQYVSLSVASSTRKDETVWRYVNCYLCTEVSAQGQPDPCPG